MYAWNIRHNGDGNLFVVINEVVAEDVPTLGAGLAIHPEAALHIAVRVKIFSYLKASRRKPLFTCQAGVTMAMKRTNCARRIVTMAASCALLNRLSQLNFIAGHGICKIASVISAG